MVYTDDDILELLNTLTKKKGNFNMSEMTQIIIALVEIIYSLDYKVSCQQSHIARIDKRIDQVNFEVQAIYDDQWDT